MSPEQLPEHERELDHRHNPAAGLEVQFVWNSLLNLAYSKVFDHNSGDHFSAIAPDGVHPVETFRHPFMYRVVEFAVEGAVILDVESDERPEGV